MAEKIDNTTDMSANKDEISGYDPEQDLTVMADKISMEDKDYNKAYDYIGSFKSYKETKDYYEEMISLKPTYAQYNCIGGMPPSFDNYIDPPADFFGSENSITDDTTMTSLGMDFTEACIVRGQFVNLIPIDIRFRGLAAIAGKAADLVASTVSAGAISFDTEEVMQSQLRWAEYWNTVNYHFRACVMMLDMVNIFGNSGISAGADIPGFKNVKALLSDDSDVTVAVDDGSWFGADTKMVDEKDSSKSMLRAICGMTSVDKPSIPFYVDGFVEVGESSAANINESEIYGAWKQAGDAANGTPVGIVKEWMQHSGSTTTDNSTLLWNPVVPKVFKDFNVERTYTYKQKLVSIGSDPLSILLYVLRVLCQYFPFIRPRAASSSLNTYRAPFYLQAYSKGMMNVKFGIIQSVEINRDPQFVTSQGIPTQLELNVSLCSLSTMEVLPNMAGAWKSILGDQSYANFVGKEGAAINYLATVCGLNAYNMSFMSKFKLRLKSLKAMMRSPSEVSANISRMRVDTVDKLML